MSNKLKSRIFPNEWCKVFSNWWKLAPSPKSHVPIRILICYLTRALHDERETPQLRLMPPLSGQYSVPQSYHRSNIPKFCWVFCTLHNGGLLPR